MVTRNDLATLLDTLERARMALARVQTQSAFQPPAAVRLDTVCAHAAIADEAVVTAKRMVRAMMQLA